ncbi:hypothetical protein AMQ83_18995, partial [Paenibacillus riograndensis]
RKKQRGLKGIIRYLISPLIGFGVVGFIRSGFDPMTYYIGFTWLFIGIIIGAIKSKGYKEFPPVFGAV